MNVTFARRVFAVSGIYGVLVLLPQYFVENRIGQDYPPPIAHPEYFYGFTGVALAWQVMFLIIATDPVRYRPAMLAAILEKISFGVACLLLYVKGRIAGLVLGLSMVDLVWATLFTLSYRATGRANPAAAPGIS